MWTFISNLCFLVSAFCLLAQTTTCYGQGDTFTWTNGGSDSRWRNEDNWAKTTSASPRKFPSFEDTAIFLSDTSVSGAGGSFAAEIQIGEDVRVTINESFIIATDNFNNQGELTFLEDSIENNPGNGLDLALSVFSTDGVTLDGGGTIRLNGSETGIEHLGGVPSLTTNVDNTIRGNGTLIGLDLINRGTIIAEDGDFFLTSSSVETNGGGQFIVSQDGSLVLGGSTISGNLLGDVGAALKSNQSSNLSDLVVQGDFLVGDTETFFQATLQGTITNEANLAFVEDNVENIVGSGLDQEFFIGSDVLLTGGGTIRLNGSETGNDPWRWRVP